MSVTPIKKRILITGGSGLLASGWAATQASGYEIILVLHRRTISMPGVITINCSLDSVNGFAAVLQRLKPDIVIHTAGLTNIEDCERDPDLAWHLNVKLAENVAVACADSGVRLVHISTDHLFDGSKAFHLETDIVTPVNFYGKSKAAAEERVLAADSGALVIRTNFYCWGPSHRQSFSDLIFSSLNNGVRITLFDDVFFTPLESTRLFELLVALLGKSFSGIYNFSSDDRISKYEFGLQLAKVFELDASLISAGSIRSRLDLVQRPSDMSLSNRKLRETLNTPVDDVLKGLNLLHKNLGISGSRWC